MEAAVTSARATYLHAARLRDAGRPFRKEAAVAKLVATDNAMRVTTDAVQVLGGRRLHPGLPARALHARGEGDPDLRGHQPDPATRHLPPAAPRLTHRRTERPNPLQINDSTVALVTGGASGLGGATVAPPARRRALPSSSSTSRAPPAQALADELGDRGAVRRPPTCATRRRCRRRSTRPASSATLRIVVNCAGVATPGRVVGKRRPARARGLRERHRHQPRRHVQRAAPRRRRDARQRARRRRPWRHRHDRVASPPTTARSARPRMPRARVASSASPSAPRATWPTRRSAS